LARLKATRRPPERFLKDRQRAFLERLGVGIAALSAIQRRNVIEARGDVGVIGSPLRAKLLIGTAL
jgi:hypothetical protein